MDITGIDKEITMILDPKSILFAIAFSPESLHILIAYSVKIEIPVIFNKIPRNCLLIYVLSEIDWNNLRLNTITIVPKNTKAPKYFNEASILAFMENPKSIETEGNLVGLGTAATRHTFIPKLLKSKYIKFNKKDIVITELGKAFLEGLTKSPAKLLADISQTTKWEEQLKDNPELFLENIKEYIRNSVSTPMNLKSDFAKFQTKQNYNKKRRA